MDLNELILQGSALAVLLGSFLLILQFLLNSFAKTMGQIEEAQHATTQALLEMVHVVKANNEKIDSLKRAIEK